MTYTLMYVSKSTLPPGEAEDQIASIIANSRARNARAKITGALIYTGNDFAQVLEGEEDAVRALMSDIARDKRHDDVAIVSGGRVPGRLFGDWTMAYNGVTSFLQRQVAAVRSAPDGTSRDLPITELRNMMLQFVRTRA